MAFEYDMELVASAVLPNSYIMQRALFKTSFGVVSGLEENSPEYFEQIFRASFG
jgi:hypothetical protein